MKAKLLRLIVILSSKLIVLGIGKISGAPLKPEIQGELNSIRIWVFYDEVHVESLMLDNPIKYKH